MKTWPTLNSCRKELFDNICSTCKVPSIYQEPLIYVSITSITQVNINLVGDLDICKMNGFGSVMVSMIASSAIDRVFGGFESWSRQILYSKMCIRCFFISTKLSGVRVNTGWFGIIITCSSGETCLPPDCCFSEL